MAYLRIPASGPTKTITAPLRPIGTAGAVALDTIRAQHPTLPEDNPQGWYTSRDTWDASLKTASRFTDTLHHPFYEGSIIGAWWSDGSMIIGCAQAANVMMLPVVLHRTYTPTLRPWSGTPDTAFWEQQLHRQLLPGTFDDASAVAPAWQSHAPTSSSWERTLRFLENLAVMRWTEHRHLNITYLISVSGRCCDRRGRLGKIHVSWGEAGASLHTVPSHPAMLTAARHWLNTHQDSPLFDRLGIAHNQHEPQHHAIGALIGTVMISPSSLSHHEVLQRRHEWSTSVHL